MFERASIRWRLPLSYAGIALLVALSLGGVLLATLQRSYAQQEADYLRSNATEIGAAMADMLENDLPPGILQSQLEIYALLTQTEIQAFDAQGDMLAEADTSGDVQIVSLAHEYEYGAAQDWTISSSDQTIVTSAGGQAVADAEPNPALDETISGPLPLVFTIVTTPRTKTLTASAAAPVAVSGEVRVAASGEAGAAGAAAASAANMVYAAPVEGESDLPPALVSSITVVGTRLGLGFDPAAAWDGRRSSQVVELPIVGTDGESLGTLRFSNGPAYGLDIVASVARGWALASLVAVTLAALVGWRISRSVSRPVLALTAATTRMAAGDLAARVTVARRDEFGQLAASFNRMADQLAGTIAALRRFVADAAHELHTPLTALHTDLELAAGEAADAARHELVIRAQAQLARLEALTASLLDLSRLEAAAAPATPVPLDLVAVVRQVSEPYASRAEQASIDLRLDLPETPVVIAGDAGQLARALGNLLDNACKFTPPGGEIAVRLRGGVEWAEIAVQDSGIGIPEEDLPQLFQRFHRAHNAAGYPGSGLGLAIARAVATGHGGEIRAEHTIRGARFILRLPRQRP